MENEYYKKTNREVRMAPKSNTKHWCESCDNNMVSSGEKCVNCGHKDCNGRLKRDT